jgi:hypothetical protein
MKLTLMIEQPPEADPRSQELDTSQRGWVTVLDEHGTPLLRLWIDPEGGSLGLGIYGPLGDFIMSGTLSPTESSHSWRFRYSG